MIPTLRDRLRRELRREPEKAPPPTLARLEQALAGQAAEDLPLKERLQRLVDLAVTKQRERRAVSPPRARLEELVPGGPQRNERGEFFLVEEDRHLESFHGEVPLSRFATIGSGSVRALCDQPDLEDFDPRQAVFLDTETTGLSGGTGTAAFLIGVGYLDDDRFRVQQFLMRDYDEEAAQLHAVSRLLSRFRYLVTFNGKAFDVPLLESRFRLNRSRFPLHRAPHLDLLHPARRLWKARLESCRLQSLEVALLRLTRHEDVDGWEIPQVYFDWVRRRDPRGMARVLEHNRLDILSLAALTAHACHVVQGTEDADDPRDLYCLARVLERAGQPERALSRYRLAVEGGQGAVRVAALLRLGSLHRRAGEHAAARAAWEEAAAAGDWVAHQRLAIHHERRGRDLSAALSAVERGLCLLTEDDPQSRRARRELLARRERILARQARRAERAGNLTPSA